MKKAVLGFLFTLCVLASRAQSVPFPTGPRDDNALEPWGYEQKGTNWNTAPYLPFIYHDRHFRLMPPNGVSYNSSTKQWSFQDPGAKYPLILFFHGLGETGHDNNMQLLHGGEKHKIAVQNGTFPGFLLYPQSATVEQAHAILEKIIIDLPVDVNRIYVHGLSNGGVDTWKFTIDYPTLVAAAFPMSASDDRAKTENLLYTPLRQAQGGLDTNPGPWWSQTIVDWFIANGGHLEYLYLPNVGHGTWNTMYNRSDFFSWFLSKKKNQIQVRFNRNEQCPEEVTNVTMGFTPGFDDYEWLKNDVPFASGPTIYKITVTEHGFYKGRIKNRGVWSDWSEAVEVKYKSQTTTPPIQLATLQSTVVPDINGNTSISITLPPGYETYSYYKNGSETPFATTQSATVNTPGSYTAKVKEFGGCSSSVSVPFLVVDANGPGKPDPILNLQASAISKTEVKLTWENNTSPTVNEIGFEIYRSLNGAGPYALIGIAQSDILSYSDKDLPSNTVFFYRVRPVASDGAANPSLIASATTETDITPPSAPGSLTVTGTTNTSVGLSWTASTDDVGVTGYDVFIRQHGQTAFVKAYSTTSTTQNVSQLTPNTLYSFVIKAKDEKGNLSPASQIVIAPTILKGLMYSYYQGVWNALPSFSALLPAGSGLISNFSLSPRTDEDNFGFVYTGSIQIPSSGQYTFYTSSDDGSKMWVNNTLVVNNDGLHGTQERSGIINLSAGYYPIRVEFFERTGDNILECRWAGPGISKQLIPSSRLTEGFSMPAAPSAPSGLSRTVIDFRSIRLNWSNYTGTGTEIEIYRSLNGSSWSIINTVGKESSTYTDTNLQSSTRYYYRLRAVNSGNVSGFTTSVNGTTYSLPPLPAAPSGLDVDDVTSNSAIISWNDNSTNEDNFEVYKSTGNNSSYTKIATLPANTTEYTDNSLFPHTLYYYRVVSKNVTGISPFSNETQTTSLNNSPALSGARNVFLRHDEVISVPLTASDPDNDFLVIGGVGLPTFAQVFDDGNGSGLLTLMPTADDLGEYNGLELFTVDGFGGQHTVPFNIVVNQNHSPVIAPLTPIVVNETSSAVLVATATDADEQNVTWSIDNAPAFVNSSVNGNSIQLIFAPGINDAGNYSITLTATDPQGSTDWETINLSVQNYDPNFNVKVNFRTYFDGPPDWSNVGNDTTSLGTYPLTKEDGTPSGISLTLVDEPLITPQAGEWWSRKDAVGVVPGIFPDVVNKSLLYFFGNKIRTIRLEGLNPGGKYNLKFLASNLKEQIQHPWLTNVSIYGQAQSIAPINNASTLLLFAALSPTAEGVINILVSGPANGYACLNAIVIESYYEGHSPPAAPSNLEATVANEAIQVTWFDNASNEQSVELFKSTDNVNFTKIQTFAKDATNYLDEEFTPGVTYYYKTNAVNGIGASEFSNTGSIVAPNRKPSFISVPVVNMPELEMQWVEVAAIDGDNDQLDFTLENPPPFMWSEYLSNEKVNLVFAPSVGDHGTYQFFLHCDDTRGGRATAVIDLTVTDINDLEYRISFTGSTLAPSPWNNVTSFAANTVASNLKRSNNTTTPVSLTLVTAWDAINANGYTTGNNSGIYPDAVMVNSYYFTSNTTRTILLSGLNLDKAYDFTFFSSRMGISDIRRTIFTIGTVSTSLVATNNASTVAKIVGVRPNANGQVVLNVTKDAGSAFAYLNAMVIREYILPPSAPEAPKTLTSQVLTRSSIKLTWQDQSNNETGFEIWKSDNTNTNYQLLATVEANSTSFMSSDLSMNSSYHYKVRAINDVGPSSFSNESSASTYEYSVSINYFAVNGGPASWNNLYYLNAGEVATNLKDDMGNNTGISMTVVDPFAGTNPFGMYTGNDSGIVPDQVMEGSWWIDRAGVATLRFGNLSFLKQYNFSFFGSRNGSGDRTTVYVINQASVFLNASHNTANMVQIKDVVPDPDGTITLTITTTAAAQFGYLNGLIIQAVPNAGGTAGARLAGPSSELSNESEISAEELRLVEDSWPLEAYPNAFVDRATLRLGNSIKNDFKVSLISINGMVLFEESFSYESDFEEVELEFVHDLPSGIYLLRVLETSGASHTLRILRK